MNKSVILIGLGGHASVLLDILALNHIRCVGYIDSKNTGHCDLEYLGTDEIFLDSNRHVGVGLINGVGTIKSCALRNAVYLKYKQAGFEFVCLVHPSAIMSSTARFAEGVQVCARSTIQPYACIGENAIINTGAIVEHHASVGRHSHIAPAAVICGSAVVGEQVLIGAGAVVLPGVKIASHSVIGAGAVIHRDISHAGIYVGNPHRELGAYPDLIA